MRTKKRKSNNDIIIKLGLLITVIVFIVIIFRIINIVVIENNKIDLAGENYYQYFMGIIQEYSGNIKVEEKNDNIQLILEDGKIIYLDSTPIYYKDILGKVLFAKPVELVVPDTGVYKLDKFTNVIKENFDIKLKKLNNKNGKNVSNAFIFDGNDLYFFLDETIVKVGSEEYVLSPLSYVIVNYRDNVEMYNYDKDEYIIIDDKNELISDVIATNRYSNYDINLSVDSLSTEKSEQLLMSNIKNLSEFEY